LNIGTTLARMAPVRALGRPWIVRLLCAGALATASHARAQPLAPPRRDHDMVRTPIEQGELTTVLREGHLQAYGVLPGQNRLIMAWAQVALENGMGRYAYNHNLGNLVPSRGQDSFYSAGDKHRYRHFDSFIDAAGAYWRVLGRCPPALRAFDAGNPRRAAAALRGCAYFEAPVEAYAEGLVGLQRYAYPNALTEEMREEHQRIVQASIDPARCVPTPDDLLISR